MLGRLPARCLAACLLDDECKGITFVEETQFLLVLSVIWRWKPPEAFDAIDVDGSLGKLVLTMIDADVAIPEIDQAVVAAPAIGVDDGAGVQGR